MSTPQVQRWPHGDQIGPAAFLLKDQNRNAYVSFGAVEGAEVEISREKVERQEVVNGVQYTADTRVTQETVMVRGTFKEVNSPLPLHLLLNPRTPLTKSASVSETYNTLATLVGTDEYMLDINDPLIESLSGAPDSLAAATTGSGSSLTAGDDYQFWVEARVDNPDGDDFRTQIDSQTGAVASVTSGDKIHLQWSNSPLGFTPNKFVVYGQHSGTETPGTITTSAEVYKVIDGEATDTIISSDPSGLEDGDGNTTWVDNSGGSATALRVQSEDGNTIYDANSDYNFDLADGWIARDSGGSISDGEQVLVTVGLTNAQVITQTIGDAGAANLFGECLLVALQDTQESNPIGKIWEFDRLELTPDNPTVPHSTTEFADGSDFEFRALRNGPTGRIGECRIYAWDVSQFLTNYDFSI